MSNIKTASMFIVLILLAETVTPQKSKPVSLVVKTIDKNLTKVSDSLYASRFETSNAEYNLFLQALKQNNPDLYKNCLVDSANWPLRYQRPMMTNYHRHPAFADYPVVNISYDAAVEYCKWLTDQYNQDKKRKFNKVLFTLPAQQEWVMAAQGGHKDILWPWSDYYLIKKNGMPICNFKQISDAFIVRDSLGKPAIVNYPDGLTGMPDNLNEMPFYTSPVKSFEPNDFGLYNVVGNVAEMIDKKNYAMGGSWNSYSGEITTTSIRQYKETSPEIGFRVFMKILEL